MPNNVSNKIELNCNKEQANAIIADLTEKDCVDFSKLIPVPLTVYQADLGSQDEEDFEENTWREWNIKHWGTKWNAYEGKTSYIKSELTIYFETAWSVPYPFIIAFANKYKLPFTYKVFDEGENFYFIEKWEDGKRKSKDKNVLEILKKEFGFVDEDEPSA